MSTLLVRDLDTQLKKEFHLLCIKNNSNMNAEIKKLISEYVKREAKK